MTVAKSLLSIPNDRTISHWLRPKTDIASTEQLGCPIEPHQIRNGCEDCQYHLFNWCNSDPPCQYPTVPPCQDEDAFVNDCSDGTTAPSLSASAGQTPPNQNTPAQTTIIATTMSSTNDAASSAKANENNPSPTGTLSTAIVATIVVVGVLLVLLGIGVAVVVLKRLRSSESSQTELSADTSNYTKPGAPAQIYGETPQNSAAPPTTTPQYDLVGPPETICI
eukprot:CAMPEP_0168587096 /NCGR_PEP_ID=MMETSP0420-20121227/4678_1 /TAXON_ID=498008 /ORGANISM="Pessonella sp." /LENGTH=221 /DNA_ID=CAMNT_0008622317 /DNA_START=12 /DNA_END=677 /DNA_ORIENTATION=-